MLSIGSHLPNFSLCAVKSGVNNDHNDSFITIDNTSYKGKWLILFFWPKDFTFVCPTEISEFGNKNDEFIKNGAQILGVSTDSEFVHLAWKKHDKRLTNLPFPMLSDIKHDLSKDLGVYNYDVGVANRTTFIIDDKGVIRFVSVTDLSIGRNVDEVLRVLVALKTGQLTPCQWIPGEKTLS